MRRVGVIGAMLFAIAALASAAQARLVYVRHAASASPEVWAARDGGGHRVRLGNGSFPVISADGERVAWVTVARREAVWIAPADGSGRPRRVVRASTIGDFSFSPDGRRLAVALPRHLAVFDTATRRHVASVRGRMRGFSWAADSQRLVYARASSDDFDAPVDLYETTVGAGRPTRVTRGGRSLNPVWGADGTVLFDRAKPRRNDAPVFQIYALAPFAGARPKRITHMRVPPLLSGLVPLELSGAHLLAEFEGQDTSLGYTLDMRSGRIRALSRKVENGFVASDLSADGRTVLGTTGGPEPGGGGHDVVTVPFRGGRPTVLIRNAAEPHWTR